MSRPVSQSAPSITVVACMRNEGPYVVEWVAHLKAIGVTYILVYTNDCEDGTEAILQGLAPWGVTHVDLGQMRGEAGQKPQWRALGEAWAHPLVEGADWVAHLDCDEWIALNGPMDLPDLIANCGNPDAIALPWRLFGCGGQLQKQDDLTPERFSRAAPVGMAYPAQGSFFKTLFRKSGPFTGFGVHRPRQADVPVFADDRGSVDEELAQRSNRIMLWRGGAALDDRLVQLNHYSVRSVHEFLIKTRRGLPNKTSKVLGLEYWVERNFNQIPCVMISPQLPKVKGIVAKMMAVPDIRDAADAAQAWHDQTLKAVIATPEGARLCGRLVLASGSYAPPPDLGRLLVAQIQSATKDEK